MKRKKIKLNRFRNNIYPLVMIGENPIVTKSVLVVASPKMIISSINFINFKRKLQMKTIATLIATLLATAAFATEPAKPATPAATPAATASAPAKEEMKLAKKKEGAKQDSTKSTKPVKDEKATAKTEPAATAKPAAK
jgi:hypothetical protein